MGRVLQDRVAAVREFNRFYTGVIGLLNEHILDSPFTLLEARVLYELLSRGATRPADIARDLGIDPGQLSRLVTRLRNLDLVDSQPNPDDRRAQLLLLTPAGRAAAERLDAGSATEVASLLETRPTIARDQLVGAMTTIRALLARDRPKPVLRPEGIGDLGELIARQARVYHAEFGWNAEFEALIARIYADYQAAAADPPKRLWVAEIAGEIAGSIFIIPAGNAGMAQLRMLYVEPWARGMGLGARLVDEAVGFSREAGYRGVMLWTQSLLVAARRLYDAAGFRLESENRHHSFGKDLTGQYLRLDFA